VTLAQLRRLALALPDAVEAPHHAMTSFRVRGTIFATVPPEGTHAHLFVDEARRATMLALQPGAYEPLRWGGRVVGLRVTLAKAKAADVGVLLENAWARKKEARRVPT
jgi:hypothetical protein